MKIASVILFLSCVVLMSCDDQKNSASSVEPIDNTDQDLRITAKVIEGLDYNDYVLSSEAEEAIVKWEKYKELDIQISFLKKADYSFFDGDKEALKTFIGAFKTQIPEELKTNPILSRAVIVETALLKLNENLTIDNIDRSEKLSTIKEVFIAFSNLNYLINKKLERDIYDKIQPE